MEYVATKVNRLVFLKITFADHGSLESHRSCILDILAILEIHSVPMSTFLSTMMNVKSKSVRCLMSSMRCTSMGSSG